MVVPLFYVAFVSLVQAHPDEDFIRSQIALLKSVDPALREEGMEALKGLKPTAARTLKRLTKDEKDPEVTIRVQTVLHHFAKIEGDHLWTQGQVNAALLKYAEASGSSKPREYVTALLEETKKSILRIYPVPSNPTQFDEKRRASRVVKKHGRWALPFLLGILDGSERYPHVAVGAIIAALEASDTVPPLCQALKSKNRQFQTEACEILAGMGADVCFKYPRVVTAMKALLEDAGALEQAKDAARRLLKEYSDVQEALRRLKQRER